MKTGEYICIRVFTRADIATMGDAVLAAIAKDRVLAPHRFGPWEPLNTDLEGARSLWRSEAAQTVGFLNGERKRPFRVSFAVAFGVVQKRPFHSIFWDADPVALRRAGAEGIEALFLRLVAAAHPYWAVSYYSDDFEWQNVYKDYEHDDGSIEPYRIVGVHPERFLPGLYWLNYFGPELTASMPALAKGACGAVPHGKGTLLKLANDPLQMTSPESIERIEQCKRELGEHRFFVKNPELEEDGETIEVNLTGAPLPTRRSGRGSR